MLARKSLDYHPLMRLSFLKRVLRIEAERANTLRFAFADGTTCLSEWNDRSRSESWTDEMKQAAKVKSLAIREALHSGSVSEEGNEN